MNGHTAARHNSSAPALEFVVTDGHGSWDKPAEGEGYANWQWRIFSDCALP